MLLGVTTFLDIELPNAATWACMGLVLVVMIFFRFAHPLRIRNWDILLLFILAIPLLYLKDRQERRDQTVKEFRDIHLVSLATEFAPQLAAAPMVPGDPWAFYALTLNRAAREDAKTIHTLAFEQHEVWRGYFWLLVGSALLLVRSLVDLGLDRKGQFRPNLTTGGIIWLTMVLLAIMVIKPFIWKGVPQQQHESIVLTYLQENLAPSLPLGLAMVCHALIITMLILIGITIFRNAIVGASAAVLYLLLPYTALLLTDATQVVASVFIILAVLCYRRPMWAGFSLGLGTCIGFFPAILIPAWFGFYFGRGHWRFLFTSLAVVLGMVIFLMINLGLDPAWEKAWGLAEWQAWKFAVRPKADGLWNTVTLHVAYRIPLFILFLALVVTSALWPHPKNLGQLISWSAVLILGVQFWYADAGGIYILWYLPLVILQTLRPSLSDHRPALIEPETDRVCRFLRWAFPRKQEAEPEHRKLPPPTALAG
jgi:hypothetical protein